MIWETFTQLFRATAEFFGFASKRQDLKNQPAVVAAEVGQKDVDAKERIEDHVEKRDVDATRKDIAG